MQKCLNLLTSTSTHKITNHKNANLHSTSQGPIPPRIVARPPRRRPADCHGMHHGGLHHPLWPEAYPWLVILPSLYLRHHNLNSLGGDTWRCYERVLASGLRDGPGGGAVHAEPVADRARQGNKGGGGGGGGAERLRGGAAGVDATTVQEDCVWADCDCVCGECCAWLAYWGFHAPNSRGCQYCIWCLRFCFCHVVSFSSPRLLPGF